MTFSVKEVFYTLQGEGMQAGKPAVFCRFAGCNLWSGREADRSAAICRFCDTDFVGTNGGGGGKFASADDLANAIERAWVADDRLRRLAVLTGGEPLLQVDEALTEALHARGFKVAVETNGTVPAPAGIDWICVSPKAGTKIVVRAGQELKLVFPQPGIDPAEFVELQFANFCLQPMDGADRQHNTQLAIAYCQTNPQWRLSIQTHKLLGIR